VSAALGGRCERGRTAPGPGGQAATIPLAEPLTAAILGVALLGERLTTAGFAGASVLVAGLALLAAPMDLGARKRTA
jgi:DME family drug/metabolite transporter